MEKDEKEYIEKVRKRGKVAAVVCMGIMLIGAGFAIASILMGMNAPYADRDHLTDPDIPYSQLDNATYTWTAEEIADRQADGLILLAIGAVFFVVGYAGAAVVSYISPGQREYHRQSCNFAQVYKTKDNIPESYVACPECGVKLERLYD